jgi:hypothetical protein
MAKLDEESGEDRLIATYFRPGLHCFVARTKRNSRVRDRCGETLFIEMRKKRWPVDGVRRKLRGAHIAKIAGATHSCYGSSLASFA